MGFWRGFLKVRSEGQIYFLRILMISIMGWIDNQGVRPWRELELELSYFYVPKPRFFDPVMTDSRYVSVF